MIKPSKSWPKSEDHYGYEIIMDLQHCNKSNFNRKHIKKFYIDLCDRIDMERGPLRFWDYRWCPWEKKKAPIHVRGTSAVQFILTSSIVIHAIDDMGLVFIDVFSCKDFNSKVVVNCAIEYFGGNLMKPYKRIVRG